MTKQISIHKDQAHGADALWWKPMFTMQREMCKACQHMVPENLVPAAAWEASDDMLATMQNGVHSLFSQLFNNRQMMTPWLMGHQTEPYIDITESNGGFVIKADVPGVDVEELDVSIADSALIIKGKKQSRQHEGDNYLRHECCVEPFSRTVALPEEADIERASANFDQNVLTVEIPKKAVVKPRKLAIASERVVVPVRERQQPTMAKAS